MTDTAPLARIGLGTVQFGLDYGVTNSTGIVPASDVAVILRDAAETGVTVLDTAALYGASEEVLGQVLPAIPHHFRIVTKTGKHLDAATAREAEAALLATFSRSLERLRCDRIDALLTHDSQELLGPFGEARWRAMSDLRAAGAVARIGASVYSGDEIDALLDRYDPDLIQVPLNAIDQRLHRGGQLDRLASRGVKVHVRSVFLQGLLLQPPAALKPEFAGLRPSIQHLVASAAEQGVPVAALLIHMALAHASIECALVGVASPAQWRALARHLPEQLFRLRGFVYSSLPITDERLLNPAQWATLAKEFHPDKMH